MKGSKTQKKKPLQKKKPKSSPKPPKKPEKRNIFRLFVFLTIPLVLLFIFVQLFFFNKMLLHDIEQTRVNRYLTPITPLPYPLLKDTYVPEITASSAAIMENRSKVVIFAKFPDMKLPMASTTKLMTALVGLEFFAPKDVLIIRRENVEGTTVGFKKGERIFFEDLLFSMLLPSGNDAAYAIADNYPGGHEAFVEAMNNKARALYLTNTHFSDPAGLDDERAYTTAIDLANLSSIAIAHDAIARITGTKTYRFFNADGTGEYEIENLNKLLGSNGVTGIKTGFTKGAEGVLTTAKIENGQTFIIVVMKSKDRFADTQSLLRLITNNVDYFDPIAPL